MIFQIRRKKKTYLSNIIQENMNKEEGQTRRQDVLGIIPKKNLKHYPITKNPVLLKALNAVSC